MAIPVVLDSCPVLHNIPPPLSINQFFQRFSVHWGLGVHYLYSITVWSAAAGHTVGKPRARFELGTGDLEAGTRNTRPPHLVISYCDTFDAPDVTVELLLLLELLAAGPAGDQPAGQPVPQALVMRISHKVEKTLAAMLARVPLCCCSRWYCPWR